MLVISCNHRRVAVKAQDNKCFLMADRGSFSLKLSVIYRALLFCLTSCLSGTVKAEQQEFYQINLPARPVAEALNDLSEQTGVPVLFPYDLVKNRGANPVVGRYTLLQALAVLLTDTGLSGGLSDNGVVVISPTKPELPKQWEETMKQSDNKQNKSKQSFFAGIAALFAAMTTSTNVMGEEASNKTSTLEEVIVTAQKREQNLLDTPISIAVLQGSDLDRGGYRSVSDVINTVGGVNLVATQPGDITVSVRGTAADPIVGSSTVGYYLDEVPFSFITKPVVPDAGAFDLERVEVLRGPQGTLYGVNALNGVIRIITKDADLENFELKTRARISTTDDGGTNGMGDLAINVPLIPGKLAVRAVASYSELSGFINSPVADDTNDSEIGSYRLKINAQATDNLALEFGMSISNIDTGASYNALEDMTTPFSLAQPDEREYDAYNLELQYDFASFSILSATSYIDYTTESVFPRAFIPGTESPVDQRLDSDTFSQELRATSTLDGPWQWSAGIFYREADEFLRQAIPDLLPFPTARSGTSESYAVFGEIVRAFVDDKVDLTVGLRYFEDTVEARELSNFFTGTSALAQDVESDFDDVSGRAILTYYPNSDTTLYASYATGFRSGFNQPFSILTNRPDLSRTVEPDSLQTYEIGIKGTVLSGRLTYDTVFYYTNWEDVQQALFIGGLLANINSESVSGFGIDASLIASPLDSLTLQLNLGWNDMEHDDDVIQSGAVLFSENSRLNNSPEYTAGGSIDYEFPVGVGDLLGRFSFIANYSSKKINAGLDGDTPTLFESGDNFNANMKFDIGTDNWSAGVFVDNLTNEDKALSPSGASDELGTAPRLRPRTIGIQLSYNY